MRLAFLLFLIPCGCSNEPTTSTHPEGNSITSVDMRADGQGSTVTFDTGTFRGILEIEPGILTGYQLVTQTGSKGGAISTKTLTIAGRELSIEGSHLHFGDRVIGPFSGEVKVDIKKDGIFVDGKKQSDF